MSADAAGQRRLTRRDALKAGAAIPVAAALASGPAAAQTDGLNYDAEVLPEPRIEGDVEIGEIDRADMSGDLAYINDSGETADLGDHGAAVQPPEDAETPHNPVTIAAHNIHAPAYTHFPRNQTYEDSDEDTVDLDWTDSTHWTASSVTATEDETEAGGAMLNLSADAAGGTYTFAPSAYDPIEADPRNYIQLVVNVNTLPAGAVVAFIVRDVTAGNSVEVTIDPSGDAASDTVVATATGDGFVLQTQLGDISGFDNLENIEEVEIEFRNDTADIDLVALALERPETWDFGTQEYLNSDDEVDTQTIEEPSGTFDITSLSTLGSVFNEATVANRTVAIEYHVADLPNAEDTDHRFSANERSSLYDRRFEQVVNFDLELGFDLSYSNLALVDTQHLSDGQYQTVEFVTGENEHVTLEDIDEENVSGWTEVGDSYIDQGEAIELTTAFNADDRVTVYLDLDLTEEQEDLATSASGGGGGPIASGGDGGIMDLLFSPVGAVLGAIAGFLGLRWTGILGGEGR